MSFHAYLYRTVRVSDSEPINLRNDVLFELLEGVDANYQNDNGTAYLFVDEDRLTQMREDLQDYKEGLQASPEDIQDAEAALNHMEDDIKRSKAHTAFYLCY